MNNKRKNAQISGVGVDLKLGTGPETGVEIRYYKPHELFNLMAEEMDEITQLRPKKKKVGGKFGKMVEKGNRRQGRGKKQPWNKKLEGQVTALIKKHRKEELEEQKKETKVLAELSTLISAASGKATVDYDVASAAVKLNAIIKRRRKKY